MDLDELNRRGSPERFGHEWSTYSKVLPESKGQLERWLGPTRLETFTGKRVLDVGCGMGRNPYWMAEVGASEVCGVDIDEGSLNAARANLAPFPQARVERCSAYEVSPERLGLFDRVTCIGVLHHLQDPELALRSMWSCVAPGGDLVLWCYGREGNELILPVIRACQWLGSRLPIRVTHALAKLITVVAYPFFQLLPLPKDNYYGQLRHLSFANIESIIFDQMLPHIAHYWTRKDMERLAAPLGGQTEIHLVQGTSWHARIVKS